MRQIVKIPRKAFDAWELAMGFCPVYNPVTTRVEIMNSRFQDEELIKQGVEHIIVKGRLNLVWRISKI